MAVRLVVDHGQLRTFRILGNKAVDGFTTDDTFFAQHRHLLGNVFELAHIARPLVFHHHRLGFVREGDFGQIVFFSHLQGKQAEKQQDVFTTVPQWRHLYGDGIQTIVQVFTKTAFAHGLAHVDIGSSHHPDIRFHDLLPTHTDILTVLKHAQQARLCWKRQLAYLVKEYRTLVGHTKISLTLAYGTCKGTLFMSEEFAVDGTLGY